MSKSIFQYDNRVHICQYLGVPLTGRAIRSTALRAPIPIKSGSACSYPSRFLTGGGMG